MISRYRHLFTAMIILSLILVLSWFGVITRIFNNLPLISLNPISQANDQASPEQLQAKINSLEAEVASLLYLKSENELLKSAIVTKNDTGITPIQAKIITFDNNFTRSSAIVSAGSQEGVRENQPVIYLGHLIGVVKEVSEASSKIQFLNDSESKLAVSLQNSNASQGVLKSKFGTVLEVDTISKLETISNETNVITVATETIPAGLLVGKIQSVSEGDLFHKIIVDSPINFYKLTEVFILKT